MDARELAQKMLEWEETKAKLDALEADISAAVLEMGKTQTVGNVRASYSAGRKSYDYEAAAAEVASPEVVQAHSTTTVKVDWKSICSAIGIDEIPSTQSEPKVTVKLL